MPVFNIAYSAYCSSPPRKQESRGRAAAGCPGFPLCAGMTGCLFSGAVEDSLWSQCRGDVVGHVDDVGDAQIDGDRADDIGLLAVEPALLQQFHHVEDGVAAGEGQVLRLDLAVLVDRHAHDAEEALGYRVARIDEVAGP